MFDEKTLLFSLIGLQWCEYLWKLYLSSRQVKLFIETYEAPEEIRYAYPIETFTLSLRYTASRIFMDCVRETVNTIAVTLMLLYGGYAQIWNHSQHILKSVNEVSISCAWIILQMTIEAMLDWPIEAFNQFVIEEHFGFNKRTPEQFLITKLNSFLEELALVLAIITTLTFIASTDRDWSVLCAWIVISILITVAANLLPLTISELESLPQGGLRDAIENFARQEYFPLAQLLVDNNASHSNAYIYATGPFQSIVFCDALFKNNWDLNQGCTDDEIMALVAHEMGHWRYHHAAKRGMIYTLNTLILMALSAYCSSSSLLYRSLGFESGVTPSLVGVFAISQYLFLPYNLIAHYFLTWYSRQMEFEADLYATNLGKGSALATSLVQISKDNLIYPIYDPMFEAYHDDHPQMLERLRAIREV